MEEDALPDVYVQIIVPSDEARNCSWHLLDLNRERPMPMDWPSESHCGSVAVAVKSDICLLGGLNSTSTEDEDGTCYSIETGRGGRIKTLPMRSERSNCRCASLSGNIFLFNCKNPEKSILEVYDSSSNRWFHHTEAMSRLPDELRGIDPDEPVISDSRNNCILIHYYSKGLYAFYPFILKWECLSTKKLNWGNRFEYSVVVNNVLYHCKRNRDIRGGLMALDLSDGLKQLTVLWPEGDDYSFYYDSEWMIVDLGNGRLCMLTQTTEWSNNQSLTDSYCSKYVVAGMILDVSQKRPPPRGHSNTGMLHIKTASRVRFEFDYLNLPDGVAWVQNAVAITRGK